MLPTTAVVSTVLALGSIAGAQPVPVFVVETDGLEALAPSPADAALVRAVAMIPDRVAELGREIPDFDPGDAPMVSDAVRAVGSPMSLAVVFDPARADGGVPYAAAFDVQMDRDTAAGLARGIIDAIAADIPVPLEPSTRHAGAFEVLSPAGPVHFGPATASDGTPVLRLGFGSVPDADELIPERFQGGALRFHASMAGLQPLIRMGLGQADLPPGIMMQIDADLTAAGFLGDRTLALSGSVRHADERVVTDVVATNAGKLWDVVGLSREPIDAKLLEAVPADVYSVSCGRFTFDFLAAALDKAASYGAPTPMLEQQAQQLFGLDFRQDILAALGGNAAVYTAESTGGGGMLASVALLEIRDRERLAQTHTRLLTMADGATMLIPVAGRYISLKPWEHDGTQLFSLRFPGVPVPFEPTWAIAGDWLVVGASPQATLAAIAQATGDGDAGLVSNAAFRASVPARDDLAALSFTDHRRAFRGGFGAVSMVGSALGNAARSPWGAPREPGLVVPPYTELAEAAQPAVMMARWEGDDLVVRSYGSSSLLAGTAVKLGAWGGGSNFVGVFQAIGSAAARARSGAF